MARAVCKSCQKVTRWRAGRGARLSDLHCLCGGELKAYRDPDAGPRPQVRREVCPVCGKRKPLRQYAQPPRCLSCLRLGKRVAAEGGGT